MRALAALALALGGFCAAAGPLAAQVDPADGGITHSLGQPDRWKWTAGLGLGWGGRHAGVDNGGTASGQLGLHNDLLNPVLGAGGFNVELYAGARDTRSNGGLRARIASPALRIGFGVDYNVVDGVVRPLASVYSPVIRGGFFSNGSELRLDVLPGRSTQFVVSIETPVLRRIPAGSTRPAADHVKLARRRGEPLPSPPESIRARLKNPLDAARAAAAGIRLLNAPVLRERRFAAESEGQASRALTPVKAAVAAAASPEPAITTHVRRFHAAVELAFTVAVGDGHAATDLAAQARAILLEHVLLPYNRMLGQARIPDSSEEFARRARSAFLRVVAQRSWSPERSASAAWVFGAVLEVVEETRADLATDWANPRFVWLPLQFGLLPEEHDSQQELDALVERAVGVRFTEGNTLSYVINEQFQSQLSRTIHAARDYHVLWIHDFRGRDGRGHPDAMSYAHVLRSYLAALTQRVREYDRAGRLPVFIVLLDEWFYQVNDARLWMTLLEDPLRHRLRLPARYAHWEAAIRAAQDSLRAAVAGSTLLQAHRAQFGDAWLRSAVKVHVNITNTSDPSFWSWRVARFIPLFDNLIRDHRKLAFYDVTEEDPFKGEALFTGAGVGEHYANLAWEDRALLVRGPALLGLKTAARSALLQQGMTGARIPWHLQPRVRPADYETRIAAVTPTEQPALRALTITNETGFDAKQINVAKAVLYTLMPPGSVIKVPDSLWNSDFWGSALVGCALRGVRVLIIAPALHNAPAQAFGSMIMSHELLQRLLVASQELEQEIGRTGGMLRVGLFTTQIPPTDVAAKVRAVHEAFSRHEWLRELFGFPPTIVAQLDTLSRDLDRNPVRLQGSFESDDRPKLHLKANFFASRDAWTLMTRPEWSELVRRFAEQRLAQVRLPADSIGTQGLAPALLDVGAATVRDWYEGLSADARAGVVFYTVMGSQNQNARSMVQDGEVAIVVSSWPSVIAYIDLLTLLGQSRWVEQDRDIAALLPSQNIVKHGLAHWFRLVF